MSFYIGLLLVVPEEESVDGKPRVFWRIEEIIDMSVLKVFPGEEGFAKLGRKQRAHTYLLDRLWPALSRYLEGGEAELAPKFVIFKDDFERYPNKFPKEVVLPIYGSSIRGQMPSLEAMEAHNQALQAGERPKNLQDHREFGAPLVWIPCEKIAEMLAGSSREVRPEDKDVEPFLAIWETEVSEFAKIGGKVLILIHHSASTSFGMGGF